MKNIPLSSESGDNRLGFRSNKVWRFFSSLKLAIVLMFLLVALSLVGTFVVQIPAEYTTTPADYNWWLENIAQPQTGVWYPLLHLLGLFNVFHSIWFLSAGSFLVINVLVCSLNRWGQVQARISPAPTPGETSFQAGPNQFEIAGLQDPSQSSQQLTRMLKQQRFQVTSLTQGKNFYLTAVKNRFSPLGTYLIHLGLVLFIIGFLVGSYLGFQDSSFMVSEGNTQTVGHNTGLSLRLVSFTSDYWANGSPKDYSSQVILYENNQEVKRGTIQVNHPMSYHGIRFYQSFFGPSTNLRIRDNQGKVLYEGSLALSRVINDGNFQRPAGVIPLPQSGYMVYVIGRISNGPDTDLSEGQIAVEVYQGNSYQSIISTKLDPGVPYTSDKLEITLTGNGNFSGFQVSRDPGNSLIWIASSLFLLGLVAVFYFPQRRIQAMIQSQPDQTTTIYVRLNQKFGLADALQKLKDEFRRDLTR